MKKSLDIKRMFDSIAKTYDFLNNIISFGMHKSVKRSAIRHVPLQKGMKILDLCTGTGDIAIFISELYKDQINVTAVDFSGNMLDIAVERAKNHKNIKFIQADAMKLPFEDNFFDAVFISFGLRNLHKAGVNESGNRVFDFISSYPKDLHKGIKEIKRVVKDNGFVTNLDTGKPKGLLGKVFRLYFFNIVPLMGGIFCGNFSAYKYLPESAEGFPSQEKLVEIFEQRGFKEVKNYNFAFGTIAQQVAKK